MGIRTRNRRSDASHNNQSWQNIQRTILYLYYYHHQHRHTQFKFDTTCFGTTTLLVFSIDMLCTLACALTDPDDRWMTPTNFTDSPKPEVGDRRIRRARAAGLGGAFAAFRRPGCRQPTNAKSGVPRVRSLHLCLPTLAGDPPAFGRGICAGGCRSECDVRVRRLFEAELFNVLLNRRHFFFLWMVFRGFR